jgi:PPP family 3-phenylpropionic acid transporter
MSQPQASGARLGSLHAAALLTHGVYLPFFPLWLQSKALSPTMIGIIVALTIVVRVLATAPLLGLTDRGVSARDLLVSFYLVQVVGYGILAFTDNGVVIAVLVAAISIGQSAVIPANDLVTTVEVQRQAHLDYGRIRVYGSVSFLVASVLAGTLVEQFGIPIVVWALALIPLAGILATCLALPQRNPDQHAHRPDTAGIGRAALRPVLYVVMIGAALIQGSHGALNTFSSIYWQSEGFPDAVIGTLWAIGVVAEILVFFFLGRFVGRGSDGLVLIAVGGAAAMVRFTAMAFHPGLAATFVLQAMHGLSFGASHLGAIAALTALAPSRVRGLAQGLYGSVSALIMVASTVLSGFVYRAAGSFVFAAMAPLAVAGLALILVAALMLRSQPQRAGSGE